MESRGQAGLHLLQQRHWRPRILERARSSIIAERLTGYDVHEVNYRNTLVVFSGLCMFGQAASGQVVDREPARENGRSMVITKYGIVATSQTLASAAGVKILEAGGSAVDAAIAANAMLGLVEPGSNGIGGDLFAIVYEAKTGKLHGLNASGWAPAGLTIDYLAKQNESTMPQIGIHSVTVPGAVAGWDALHKRFGKLPMTSLLAPAIHYADEGFPVTEVIAGFWNGPGVEQVSRHENAKKLYLPDGRAPAIGQIFRNPDLGKSLRLIAGGGREAFYSGPIAKAILNISKELGGTIAASDLSEFQAEWVQPISTTYHGWTVSELPPNGQGIAALSMLNIMERFPLKDYGQNSAKALHVMIEAKKLAYADLLEYVGDPRQSPVPVAEMLSKPNAEKRAETIDAARANCSPVPTRFEAISKLRGADTIYLSVVDREGNIVSLIQSSYLGFGSGIVPAGSGFMLHNRGGLFTLERDQPNSLAGRKRPIHTIIPGFMSKGDVRIGFGIMGGWNQAQAHAQFVSNVVDHGLNIQGALEAARFTKLTFPGCDVLMEARIGYEVRDELAKLGHQIQVIRGFSWQVGGGQAVLRNGTSVNFGASDPRKDGAAVPESPRFTSGRTSR
jgi:gamma-glutamyltranspeptidase/glutathione hydrolase